MPKNLGGLGILYLECFGRSLRLRWLWYEWRSQNKPWNVMEIPCNELDGAALRNGNQHNFRQWKSGNLLDINLATGQAALRHNVKPPHNLTKKIQNSTCGSKRRMLDSRLKHHTSSTVQHIKEFVVLWNLIAEITLKKTKMT